jgi:hypothetical protein
MRVKAIFLKPTERAQPAFQARQADSEELDAIALGHWLDASAPALEHALSPGN